jgi:RHS repeat-associated protein
MIHSKTTFLIHWSLALLIYLAFSVVGTAQISGPVNVQLNSTATYTYNNGISYNFANWDIVNGTLVSSSSAGTTYTAVVHWPNLGSATVNFKNKTFIEATLPVTVSTQSSGLSNENYVYNVTPKIETTSINGLIATDKIESVSYFDGLGRPMQQVAIRAGGNSEDIITHVDYDGIGRDAKNYLPYSRSTNSGSYRSNGLSDTNTFYDASIYNEDFLGMTTANINPYSEKEFENSPLNRVKKQAAPGKDWKLGNNHEIEMEYLTNTTTTEVRHYSVTLTQNISSNVITYIPVLQMSSYYGVNELYKTITKDENHDGTSTKAHTTEEFKDKQGRVILKRTYGTSKVNNVNLTNVAHDTYYIYDVYGNLTYVLPPKAEPQTAKPDATELNELCYQYKYDHLNRLVEKKIPGKGWEYIVYNKLDLPIMTQDQNLKNQNKWLFTKYDAFGRVAYTGFRTSSASRTTFQSIVNNNTSMYVSKLSSPTTLAGTTIYYNNAAYPTTNISEILTINYYDNYTFDKVSGNSETSYGVTPITNAKGLPTGSKVRVLGEDDWITSVSYYDEKSRLVYSYNYNAYLGTTDKIKSQLTFDGRTTETSSTQVKTGYGTVTIIDRFEYDHANRLLSHRQKVNSAALDEVIASNTYDNLGQLVSKGVGGKTNQSRLQQVDYDYNIRGWLMSINDPTNLGNDLFAFKLTYNDPDYNPIANGLFNGNISETHWITKNDNKNRNYRYSYDELNRIKQAINIGTSENNRYQVTGISYDKNGNIITLNRNGYQETSTYGGMDNLVYTYETKSNKLKKVLDNGNDNYGFKDDSNITTEYTYDGNGNMLRDYNKGISSNITYNHLNLPTQVNLSGGNIQYIYDATGIKLKKILNQNAGGLTLTTTTIYTGNFVYTNTGFDDSLKFISNSEGYSEPVYITTRFGTLISGYNYVYQYKDHLGNIRLAYGDANNNGSIDATTEIIEENNYYPFGLTHKGYNNNVSANVNSAASKFKFGGKEYGEELGLDWYDVSARNYDPALGRWMNLDPLAEQMRRHSPYNFAFNNPIYFQDYDGMAPSGPGDPPSIWGFVKMYAKAKIQGAKNYVSNTYKSAKTLVSNPSSLLAVDTKTSLKDRVINAVINSNETAKYASKIVKGYQNGGLEGAISAQTEADIGNSVALATAMGGSTLSVADDVGRAAINSADDVGQQLLNQVDDTVGMLRNGKQSPSTVVGAELNGQTMVATSGNVPAKIAPSLQKAADKVGTVGQKVNGNPLGCCAEFRAGNKLLLANPSAMPAQLKFTPAVRPRTGQIVPMCQNCTSVFSKQ